MKIKKGSLIVFCFTMSMHGLHACPNCFGAPGDPISESIGMAIMFLLVVIMGTLGGIIAFFMNVAKRTKKYEQQLQEGTAEWGQDPNLAEGGK
ncbi:MAG: hypothetical protein AAGH72_04960 [Verrucomicrobiota bacterium]